MVNVAIMLIIDIKRAVIFGTRQQSYVYIYIYNFLPVAVHEFSMPTDATELLKGHV